MYGRMQFTQTAAPTISSGFGTSPSISANSTNNSFQVNVGTGGTATSGVVAFADSGFDHAPFCTTNTEQATIVNTKAVATTTQVTLSVSAAWTASALVDVHCF